MIFKSAKEAIEWYVVSKGNPFGNSITEQFCVVCSGERVLTASYGVNPNSMMLFDVVNAIVDIEKVLDRMPAAMQASVIDYGIGGYGHAIKCLRRRWRDPKTKKFKKVTWRRLESFLSRCLHDFERGLIRGGYLSLS